jgi:hypothetical protein
VLSVQGVWTPMLDIKDEKFEMKVVEWGTKIPTTYIVLTK